MWFYLLILFIINPLNFTDYEQKKKETFSAWSPSSCRLSCNSWWSSPMIQCLHPIKLRDPTKVPSEFEVPCGKCALCLSRRRANWSFRLKNELKYSSSGYFITLTYNEENCPEKCDKVHIRNFLKRFRKACGCAGIRYFLVCEYGGKFLRPHYHLLLFNYVGSRESLRSILQRTWKYCDSFMFDYGDTVGDIEAGSINYVCKYCLNSLSPDSSDLPVFISCSRHPYIGEAYLSHNMVSYVRKRFDGCVVSEGKKIPLPRSYMDKIFTAPERELIALMRYKANVIHQLKDYTLKGSELMETLESPDQIPEREYKLFNDKLKDKETKIKSKLK